MYIYIFRYFISRCTRSLRRPRCHKGHKYTYLINTFYQLLTFWSLVQILMKWWMKELMLALKSCDRIVIINQLPNESRHCQWWSWHGHHWKQIFRSRSVGAVRAGSQWNESWVTIKHGGSLIWIKCRAPNLFSYLTNLKFSIAVKFS